MKGYVYEEAKYIKRQDLVDFEELMMGCEYMPEGIEDETQLKIAFQYLLNLTEKAPDFLQAYEYAIGLFSRFDSTDHLDSLKEKTWNRWIEACERVAKRDKIFEKQVPWGYLENRPLIRGLYNKADRLWRDGDFEPAHELFYKILKTNEEDNIGARYSVKATAERMEYSDFDKRDLQLRMAAAI